MAFYNPRRPQLHLPRHLHIARWAAICVFCPLSILAASGSVMLWQLSRGPVDVTAASRLFQPIAIAAGPRAGHPAGRLTWSRLNIAWQPSSQGVPSGLVLGAQNLRILKLDGTVADHAGDAHAVLSLAALLRGIIAPRTLTLHDAVFHLRRAPDGDIDFDLPQQRHKGRGTPIQIDRLTAVDVQGVSLSLAGLPHAQGVTVGPVEAHLRRYPLRRHGHDDVATGWARAVVQSGDFQTTISLKSVQQGNAARWTFQTTAAPVSKLAGLVPELAPYELPVALSGGVDIPAHGRVPDVRNLALVLDIGAGRIDQPTLAPLDIREGHAEIRLRTAQSGLSGPLQMDLTVVTLVMADSHGNLVHLGASGTATADDARRMRHADADVEAHLDGFDFAESGAIWPERLMRGARRWVVRNLPQGRATGLHVKAHLQTLSGLDDIRPTRMEGALDGSDLTVQWLSPIAPATGVSAHLSLDGPDALTIALSHGQQPDGAGRVISIPQGQVRITGLLAKDQDAVITTSLQGDLSSFLTVLAHPRLHLLSRHPLPFTDPAGDVDAKVRLALPLTAHLKNSDMHVQVSADYQNVHLGSVMFGRAVDGASGTLEGTEDGLKLDADGLLSGVTCHVTAAENFGAGPDNRIMQDIEGSAFLDPASALKAGIGPSGLFTGHAVLNAHYIQRANDTADLDLGLDMDHAGVTLPVWAKPEGEPAQASAHMAFAGHDITALDALQAHGRTLDIAGRATTTGGHVRSILLEGFRIGRSKGSARIDLPQRPEEPTGVHLTADPLDLAPLFAPHTHDSHKDEAAAGHGSSETPERLWDFDLQAKRVYFGPKGMVGGAVAQFRLKAGRLLSGQFSLQIPTEVTATLQNGGDDQPFSAEIADMGALLGGLGLYDRISGGKATLRGHFQTVPQKGASGDERDPQSSGLGAGLPPFSGTLEMGKFAFLQPPIALTAITFLSPLQWPNDHGDHFEVRRLSMPMTVAGHVLKLHDGVIGNAALGATVEGPIDLETAALNLKGTIVPLFGLNALPGRLPGIGHALAPERGGGVLAATFAVKGTVGEPALSVNPLSMLLPGVLRNLVR